MDQLPNEPDDEKSLAVITNGNKEEVFNFFQHYEFSFTATDNNSNTVLHLVIENNKLKEIEKIEIVELFLNSNVDPNIENLDQFTALHLAVAKKMNDVIDFLIRYNASVNKRNKEGNSIAHFVIKDEHKKFNQKFNSVEINTDSDIWDSTQIESESASFMEWLIQKGFDFDVKNMERQSALDLAIDYNLLHILPILVKNTKSVNYLRGDYKSTFPQFLDHKFLPKPYCRRYISSILNILINRRPSVIVENDRDIQFINTVVTELSGMGIDNCASSWFHAIMRSCGFWDSTINYYFQILNDLLSNGADINHQDEFNCCTPLYLALEIKNVRALRFLMKNGAKFRLKAKNRRNWLHLIIEKNYGARKTDSDLPDDIRTDLFDILMNEGCDVSEADKNGLLPLHLAAKFKDATIVLKLLQVGADVDCTNITMCTPLHYALSNPVYFVTNAARVLLDHGADVNAKNYWGKRPLFLAADVKWHGGPISKVLLSKGAYVDVPDDKGKSVLSHVLVNSSSFDYDIKELLKCGADINDDCVLDLLPCGDLHGESAMVPLVEHWVKLNVADFPCSDRYVQYLHVLKEDIHELCLQEIQVLKNTFIVDRVSVYAFMHMNPEQRYAYLRNDQLLEIVNSPTIEETFPKYSTLILAKYRQTVTWKSLIDPAKLAWVEVTEIYLPDICLERIFAHLNIADLVNIIEYDTSKSRRSFKLGLSRKVMLELYA